MTLDLNFLVGLFAGLILMWIFDSLLYGRKSGSDKTRELEDLRRELAIYKKARTTAEANLQSAEQELETLRSRLAKVEQTEKLSMEQQEKLAAAEAELAEMRVQLEEVTTSAAVDSASAGTLSAAGSGTAVPPTPDDLKAIEGIGPKIEEILHEAGIDTFAKLAGSSVAALEKIVREDGGIRVAYPDTWPQQAGLASAGKWDELERLQDQLKGGRRV